MASTAFYSWLSAGRPYTLARPAQDLHDVLKAAGYTVFHYPDDAHLMADPPQDHTPFSATGWPGLSARWVGHAIDIMPTPGLMALPDLARRLIADKNGGHPALWPVKYVNWTDEQGQCWHVSWQPDQHVVSSTDKGHIHISFRSDADNDNVISASGYNPLETTMTETSEVHDLHYAMFTSDAQGRPSPSVTGKIETIRAQVGQNGGMLSALRSSVDVLTAKVGSQTIDPDALAAAFLTALQAHPEVVDALATAVAARVGMIPTAVEIAKATGELTWHGRVEG